MLTIKKIKLIVLFVFINSFIFSQEAENFAVEVGIESITHKEDKYNISIYLINPFNPIAGIQFKMNPSDIFIIEDIYGGKSSEAGFQIHKNKKGTILGFSMKGETIAPSVVSTGPDKFKKNIVLNITASSKNIPEDGILKMDCVMASKKGKSLSTKFIPFDLSNIIYLDK